jgi:hypothetical protein
VNGRRIVAVQQHIPRQVADHSGAFSKFGSCSEFAGPLDDALRSNAVSPCAQHGGPLCWPIEIG